MSPHEWKIYSLDKATGKILWERTRRDGAPRTKRHTKSSQASSTPVTDGRRVVAVFGSAGVMVAWDYTGKELWRVNLGTLDSGWFFDPAFQWGHSSSPIIYRNSVILQADVQKGSYIAAWDIATGKPLWKTERADEISTWGTPTIARTTDGRDVLVTNGTKIRGYDPASGQTAVDARPELGDHRSARRSPATGSSTSPADIRRCGRSTRSVLAPKAISRCRRDRTRTSRSRGAT